MNKNTIAILIFLLVLVVLFCIVPDSKVEIIGDFFEKIIKPIGIPLSITLGLRFGMLKYKQIKNKDEL